MSATRQQEQLAKTTSWLAQLKGNAEWAGFTVEQVEQTARERYGKALDALTVAEAIELARHYAEIGRRKAEAERAKQVPINGPHLHECISCSKPILCSRPDCIETAGEHVHCRHTMTEDEFNRTYKHIL